MREVSMIDATFYTFRTRTNFDVVLNLVAIQMAGLINYFLRRLTKILNFGIKVILIPLSTPQKYFNLLNKIKYIHHKNILNQIISKVLIINQIKIFTKNELFISGISLLENAL